MSRTDELRKDGNERAGSGGPGGAPFVRWSDDYSWLEGEVTGSFNTKYGLAVTMMVQNVHDGLGTQGLDEEGNRYEGSVRAGDEVNVGMGSATLKDKITAEDVGEVFHIAFEGWEDPKGGSNRYRQFVVVELGEHAPTNEAPGSNWDNVDEQSDGFEEAEIPF